MKKFIAAIFLIVFGLAVMPAFAGGDGSCEKSGSDVKVGTCTFQDASDYVKTWDSSRAEAEKRTLRGNNVELRKKRGPGCKATCAK
jgi:hypothetical protein